MALCCSTASGRAEERLHPIRSIEEYRRENHNYYPLHIDWYVIAPAGRNHVEYTMLATSYDTVRPPCGPQRPTATHRRV